MPLDIESTMLEPHMIEFLDQLLDELQVRFNYIEGMEMIRQNITNPNIYQYMLSEWKIRFGIFSRYYLT